ncbi:hypothetical protein FIE12Z_12368 [Fusarium flagelliforme]|uniref:Uncharacterized protein n=1 Tax=Fusarium flagelliforme TaxID=2675880 RepID=A0A395M674_9HYPO|nr:hypothetical protein FIE12Z_12368 [Fusarium flagelliforme]
MATRPFVELPHEPILDIGNVSPQVGENTASTPSHHGQWTAGDDRWATREAVAAQSQAPTQAVFTFGQMDSTFRPAASSSRQAPQVQDDRSEEHDLDDRTSRRPGQL